MNIRVEALVKAKQLGLDATQVAFSSNLVWVDGGDGQVVLRQAAVDRRSGKVTLYLDAMRARWNPDDLQSRALDVLAGAIASLKSADWDESEHPRDEDGKFAFGAGGDSGDGSSGEGYGGGLVMPEAGGGGKPKLSDFEKDNVRLGSFKESKGAADKFVDVWANKVKGTPAEFKEHFLGGVPATMAINVNHNGVWTINGSIQENGREVGTYTRTIDMDRKSADSQYFAIDRNVRAKGLGKKVLAGNVDVYQKLGIEKVTVHANIDVGGYAWARYGYVPTRSSWADLSSTILRKLGGGGGGGGGGYRPESWDEINSDEQDNIRDHWMNATASEFLESEVESWRQNGEARHVAKNDLAQSFDGTNSWATHAISEWHKENDSVPYSDEDILDSVKLTYDDNDYEGQADPEIKFDDSKLQHPTDAPSSDQMLLPGFEPVDQSTHLTPDMRDSITDTLVKAFNDQAEEDEGDVEPPDYLSDNVGEYQSEYWANSMSDRERYRWADNNGYIETIPTDPDEEPVEVDAGAESTLRQLAESDDPKALWAIADSPQGEDLLLGSDWHGVLNLKDKETMDRFNAYVGNKSNAA